MKVYREDDFKAEVEVLKDESDAQWARFTLRVVRTLRASKIYKPTPDGEVFSVDRKKDAHWGGMWTIRDEVSA